MHTKEERIYVIQCYGIGDRTFKEVIRLFNIKFPHTVLVQSTASRLIKKFQTTSTGSILNIKKQKKSYDEDNAAVQLAYNSLQEDPKMPLRKRSSETGLSKSLLQKIYKANKIRPFKAKFLHFLEEGDEARRLNFCLDLGEKMVEDQHFHKRIIFSDESTFTTNGVPSAQNCRHWSKENPNYIISSKRQYFKKVNVWCAVSYHHGIIGPYFIEGILNQHVYLNILNNFFLREMPAMNQNLPYFQQDGCPAHSTLLIREWLNTQFGARWIGRNGPISWP